MHEADASARYREARVGGSLRATFERRPDGSWHVFSQEPLSAYPTRFTDRLMHFAANCPERTLVARRAAGGDWGRVSYAQALQSARCIAQALIDRKLSVERPIVILSDNDIEHLLLGLAAMLAGVPYAAISPAYSLLSRDFSRLREVVELLTPGMVFASSDARFGAAIAAAVPGDTRVVLTDVQRSDHGSERGTEGGTERFAERFADLLATTPTAAVDAAHAAVGPDTIAKFLFTSGSTGSAKAVINTHRMLCSNQQQLVQCLPFLGEEPPVLVDWLPWSHTFGGNHNVGLVVANGGTLYIDDGKPTPALIGETLRNLREIAPTVYFNVPKGFEEIASALTREEPLGRQLFSRLKMFYFAGAGLSQAVWDALESAAERCVGERIRIGSGLGMTETSPFAICANGPLARAGHIGLPAPGVELKLVPVDGKLEVRYRGPNVTPGYWRAPQATLAAFDEEGFLRSGDAVRFVDPDSPQAGFAFDGRIAEDFKLSTGTFVSVGPLRAKVAAAGDPLLLDSVVVGADRDRIGLLLFPRIDRCRAIARLGPEAPASSVLSSVPVRRFFQDMVDALHDAGTGSASRIDRAIVMIDPPDIDRGEMTDKGSLNQRAVMKNRDASTRRLYAADADNDAEVILASAEKNTRPGRDNQRQA